MGTARSRDGRRCPSRPRSISPARSSTRRWPETAWTLIGNGDELRLMVFPVVLGDGKRLFGATSDKKPLRLTDSRTVGDGVSILVFEPAAAEA